MYQLSAIALRDLFLRGEVSARTILQTYLKRVAHYDQKIGAYLSVLAERAEVQAIQLDLLRASGKPLGKLAGVPIAIKDNIHIKGEISTCGSRFLEHYRAPFNATVIDKLEKEGAIFLGKTNMDEFAMGSSTEHSAYQHTSNPWDLRCVPGGSSGGSAAAVAARLAPLALGSDTGGSIRQPAALCGIVGFKPTYGRVSRYGLVAYASSLDQIGAMGTTVADVALATEVISGHCPHDSNTIPEFAIPYAGSLGCSINEMRIGVPWSFIGDLAQEAQENFCAGLDTLQSLGCQLVEVDLSILRHSIAVYYIIATAEASTNLARFDGIRYGLRSQEAKTLEDVYEFSKRDGFGSEVKNRILLGTYVLSAGYRDALYKKAQQVRSLMIRGYVEAFRHCDAIATPVSPFPAFPIGSIQDPLQMYLQDIYTISINLAGLPGISVPSGFHRSGKPYGMQIIGPAKRDALVLQIAHHFEQATQHTKAIPPLFDDEVFIDPRE